MGLVPKNIIISTIWRTISTLRKTHYEILNLSKDCSSKDVKKAFIELSKQYHPDKNVGKNTHATYIRMMEAYNTLSRPLERANYDLTLQTHTPYDNIVTTKPRRNTDSTDKTAYEKAYEDPSFYHNRPIHETTQESKSYYGIAGLRRISNSLIAIFCFALMTVGVTVQLAVIRTSFKLGQERSKMQSQQNGEVLDSVRAKARELGNQKQLERMFKKTLPETEATIASTESS